MAVSFQFYLFFKCPDLNSKAYQISELNTSMDKNQFWGKNLISGWGNGKDRQRWTIHRIKSVARDWSSGSAGKFSACNSKYSILFVSPLLHFPCGSLPMVYKSSRSWSKCVGPCTHIKDLEEVSGF